MKERFHRQIQNVVTYTLKLNADAETQSNHFLSDVIPSRSVLTLWTVTQYTESHFDKQTAWVI